MSRDALEEMQDRLKRLPLTNDGAGLLLDVVCDLVSYLQADRAARPAGEAARICTSCERRITDPPPWCRGCLQEDGEAAIIAATEAGEGVGRREAESLLSLALSTGREMVADRDAEIADLRSHIAILRNLGDLRVKSLRAADEREQAAKLLADGALADADRRIAEAVAAEGMKTLEEDFEAIVQKLREREGELIGELAAVRRLLAMNWSTVASPAENGERRLPNVARRKNDKVEIEEQKNDSWSYNCRHCSKQIDDLNDDSTFCSNGTYHDWERVIE